MIQVKEHVVTLKGITLRGSLQLFNPNETLAVIFEIQCPRDFQFCLEPKRGIIMQKQIKTIKIWIKDEDRERALMTNFIGKSLKITSTMKAQYNRKMMQKMHMTGWEQIKHTLQKMEVPVVISTQAKGLRSDLREQASSSLHKMSYQGSKQFSNGKQRQSFKVGQSYNHDRGTPQLYRKKISDKLDRQLDFLFENQNSRIGRENVRYSNTKQPKLGNFQTHPMNHPKGDIITYGDAVTYDKPFSTPSISNINLNNANTPVKNIYSGYNKQANNQRFLQILMLAALAGFFAALGSNLKHLLQ